MNHRAAWAVWVGVSGAAWSVAHAEAWQEPALRLTHHEASVRREAVIQLGELGTDARPAADAVGRLSHDPDPETRRLVMQALGRFKAPVGLPVLAHGLTDEDRWVRMEAEVACGSFGTEGASLLVGALSDPDLAMKAVAARMLKTMGHDAIAVAAPALLTLLEDERDSPEYLPFGGPLMRGRGVGHEAAKALSAMGADVVPLMVTALTHASPLIWKNAVKVIRPYETPEALASLIVAMDDSDPKVVQEAYWGLDLHRNEDTVAALAQAFKRYSLGKRYAVAKYFHRLGAVALRGLLEAMSDAEPLVREVAVQGLSGARTAAVRTALGHGLSDPEWSFNYARALAGHQDVSAFAVLAGHATHPLPARRAEAAAALGQLGDPRGVPVLKRLAKDTDLTVRRVAEAALLDLGQLNTPLIQPRRAP